MKQAICVSVLVGLGAVACGTAPSEQTGEASQSITEGNCGFRSVSAPTSGVVVSELGTVDNYCDGVTYSSPNSSYGYTNCLDAYIAHFENTSAVFSSRRWHVRVRPVTAPTTEAACVASEVTYVPWGEDADEVFYIAAVAFEGLVAGHGEWTDNGVFGFSCEYPEVDIDLNNFSPERPVALKWRVVAQAKQGGSKVPVQVQAWGIDNSGCIASP